MNTTGLSEKQRIELDTAEGFLTHYNELHRSNFLVYKIAGDREVPDVFAKDSQGNELGIEITLTENRVGDIKSTLGRSDHNSVDALEARVQRVKEGKEEPIFNYLTQNVLAVLVKRIKAKLNKDYGNNIALVVRDTSAVLWHWEHVVPLVQKELTGLKIPFNRGIWLLSRSTSILTSIHPEV
jgi:hypothetical protein